MTVAAAWTDGANREHRRGRPDRAGLGADLGSNTLMRSAPPHRRWPSGGPRTSCGPAWSESLPDSGRVAWDGEVNHVSSTRICCDVFDRDHVGGGGRLWGGSTSGNASSVDHGTGVITGRPAPAPTCGGVRPAKPGGGRYTCTFTDDFIGTKLDTTKWTAVNTSDNGFTTGLASALRTATWTVLRTSRSATVVCA